MGLLCRGYIFVVFLQLRRRDSGLFAGKQGYITLRDVFRWGERYRQASAQITDTFYDWDQLLADQGTSYNLIFSLGFYFCQVYQ